MSTSPLGRGLGSLIGGNTTVPPIVEGHREIHKVSLTEVKPNPKQPRTSIPEIGLAELVASVKEHGILQPLVVTPKNGGYEIIAGERRYQAAKAAGLKELPVIIRDVTEQEQLELALVENLQREDLNPLQEADAYQRLLDEFNITQDQVAKRVGKSRSYVANTLRLGHLPDEAKRAILDGTITAGHAKLLAGITDPEELRSVLATMLKQKLSVRESEALIRVQHGPSSRKKTSSRNPDVVADEDALRRALGTKVAISNKGEKGTITIAFYSHEERAALIKRLTNLF